MNVEERENPPWSLAAALLTWLASVLLLLALPQIIALPYVAAHYRGTRATSEVLLADKTLIVILVSGLLPVHLITLFIAWCVTTRFGKIPARIALRWNWNERIGILQCIVLAILLFGFAWLLALAFGGKQTELERLLESSRPAALIIAFLAVATAPLVEETIYRGILYPALQRFWGSIPAVVIVTLMFTIPHVPQYWPNMAVISSITLLSIVLTVVRAHTGRLLPCFVIHLAFNGIQSVIIVLDPYLRALFELGRHDAAPGTLIYLLRPFI